MSAKAESGARALFLSYDGMTDPLGGSQVLPYLAGLAAKGHRISLISCEKPERSRAEREQVASFCRAHGIDWHPLPYRKRPPVLSTVLDLLAMRRLAERLHREQPFDLVHCRSYPPALIGLAMKRRHGTRFLFDMRGFWADERVDGGLWDLRNPLFATIHRWFKRREADFLREADAVVSLTEAGREVLLSRADSAAGRTPIHIIPCCTDFDAFPPVSARQKQTARAALGIEEGVPVAAYLGSIGTWYLLDQMLDFFAVQLAHQPAAIFLFVTRDDPGPIQAAAHARGVPARSVIIRAASRSQVPELVAAADYGLFFIKPCFSKLASSPVKLGEFMALELPVVANAGVGDVDRIIESSGAGVLVQDFSRDSYGEALDQVTGLRPDMDSWRAVAHRWFNLDHGIEGYAVIYRELATSLNRDTRRGACDARE